MEKPIAKPMIFPIICPHLNWDTFLREAKRLTGESMASGMAVHQMKPHQDQSLVAALGQFDQGGEPSPFDLIREATNILQHLSFSFLCHYDPNQIDKICLSTDLFRTPHHHQTDICILGGNLRQWKDGIVEICQAKYPFTQRFFMNCMLVIFRCNGYSMIWENFEQVMQHDHSFVLRPKS